MGGLAASELDYRLDCHRALSFGFLPEPYLLKNKKEAEELLRNYTATYLKEEIQAEALTRNISGFSRFLVLLAERSGQILDLSKVASRAKVSRTSTLRFMEILEDTLVGWRVKSYEGAGNADVIAHPKFYFFDPGVLNGLLGNFKASADRVGMLMEHLVFSQIRNSLAASHQRARIEFFRTRHGVEVDFIVTLEDETVWAIEVKIGAVSEEDLRSLQIFRAYLSSAQKKRVKMAVVSLRESRVRVKDGIIILGLNELMREMGL